MLYGGENAPDTLVPSSGYDGISKVNFERTDANPTLVAANIRNGVKIMGVTGTYGQLQSKDVALGAAMPSTVSPATGYTGLSQVTFTKDTSVVKADNIKNGVKILGVTGSYETPTESKSVLLGADYPPAAVTPSAGKHLSSVAFSMNSNLFKAENIKAGVTLLGVTGTYDRRIKSYYSRESGSASLTMSFQVPQDLININQIVALNCFINDGIGSSSITNPITHQITYPVNTNNSTNVICQMHSYANSSTNPPYIVSPSFLDLNDCVTLISGESITFNLGWGVFPNNRFYYLNILYNELD